MCVYCVALDKKKKHEYVRFVAVPPRQVVITRLSSYLV